jgi:hypothetical protein
MNDLETMNRLFLKPRPKPVPKPPSISRAKAIAMLRYAFLQQLDPETSMCKFAADHGVFCRGFKRYGDGEIRRAYDWIARKDRQATREEIEEVANKWQIARQEVREMPLACDVQQREHDTCRGWDDFTNEELVRFVKEVTGTEYRVV